MKTMKTILLTLAFCALTLGAQADIQIPVLQYWGRTPDGLSDLYLAIGGDLYYADGQHWGTFGYSHKDHSFWAQSDDGQLFWLTRDR
jgi:hypothetical protein